MLKSIFGSVLALSFLLGSPGLSAIAAPPAVETKQVLNAVTLNDVRSIIDELDWTREPSEEIDGFDLVTTYDGWIFHIGTRICDIKDQPPGCLGIEMLAYWAMDEVDYNELADLINEFNRTSVIGKAYISTASDSNLAAWVARYVITDNGISSKNIYANLIEFNAALAAFDEELDVLY
jgi:hypothetical protein